MLNMKHRIVGRLLTMEILETRHFRRTPWYIFCCNTLLPPSSSVVESFAPQVAVAAAVDGAATHQFSNLGELLEITKMPTNLVLGRGVFLEIVKSRLLYSN